LLRAKQKVGSTALSLGASQAGQQLTQPKTPRDGNFEFNHQVPLAGLAGNGQTVSGQTQALTCLQTGGNFNGNFSAQARRFNHPSPQGRTHADFDSHHKIETSAPEKLVTFDLKHHGQLSARWRTHMQEPPRGRSGRNIDIDVFPSSDAAGPAASLAGEPGDNAQPSAIRTPDIHGQHPVALDETPSAPAATADRRSPRRAGAEAGAVLADQSPFNLHLPSSAEGGVEKIHTQGDQVFFVRLGRRFLATRPEDLRKLARQNVERVRLAVRAAACCGVPTIVDVLGRSIHEGLKGVGYSLKALFRRRIVRVSVGMTPKSKPPERPADVLLAGADAQAKRMVRV
jgi:hypothetical protein